MTIAVEQTEINLLSQQINELKSKLQQMEQQLNQLQQSPPPQTKINPSSTLPPATQASTPPPSEDIAPQPSATEPEASLEIGGAFTANYTYDGSNKNHRETKGDLSFSYVRLGIKGQYDNILFDAQYRWYDYMDIVHHAWIGYQFNDEWQTQLGITQTPFGIMPYTSHNYWEGVDFYMGLEDLDMGIKAIYDNAPWNLQLAFFKNEDYSSSSNLDRYSFDIVTTDDQANKEANQFNTRLTYTLDHGNDNSSEFGLSGQIGQLYNTTTQDSGHHWAVGLHWEGNYNGWNPQFQLAHYKYAPKNPEGVSDDIVMIGAYGGAFPKSAEGTVLIANIAKDFNVNWGKLKKLTCYNDYSVLFKKPENHHDSHLNTLGCSFGIGPVYTYVDFIAGKNMFYLGDSNGLGAGQADADWETRFNINIGYYF
ncbi:porin [Candidatus Albibeggiatoa sp. nov. NOAA]|uniref:porin n=1 Tax=Candidatus Albibeggiatoa sp. nov. NOAA TaxID=3162724 RepID=UPI0032F61604|nr:porin [Thiotrichaceae bacterium]